MALRNQRIFRHERGEQFLAEFESSEGDPMGYVRKFFGSFITDNWIYVAALGGALYFFWPVISAFLQTSQANLPRGEPRRRELLLEEEAEETRRAINRHRQLRSRLLGTERAKTKRALLKLLQDDSINVELEQDDFNVELEMSELSRQESELRAILSDVDLGGSEDPIQFDTTASIQEAPAWGAGHREATVQFEWLFASRPVRITAWASTYLDGLAVELENGHVYSAGKVAGSPAASLDLSNSNIRRVVCRSGEWLDGINFIASGGSELGWAGGTGGERNEFVARGTGVVGFRGSAPANGPIDKLQVLHQRLAA